MSDTPADTETQPEPETTEDDTSATLDVHHVGPEPDLPDPRIAVPPVPPYTED